MAIGILSAAPRSTPAGNVAYLSDYHLQEAQRIALHTAACNALSMAQWNLNSDIGSVSEALVKARVAAEFLHRLQMGGAV